MNERQCTAALSMVIISPYDSFMAKSRRFSYRVRTFNS